MAKLQIMNWNDIWHVFFVLKTFSQSIFKCPINLPKFCKFPSSNCSACSVRLQDPVNNIFFNLRRICFFWIYATIVYSKLLPITDLVFQFLIKHLHIFLINFLTEYQTRKYVQLCSISSATFLQFFHSFMMIMSFQEKSHFRLYLKKCKQWIKELCNLYLINQLKPIWT